VRNSFLQVAYELRSGMPTGNPVTSSGPDVVRAMSTDQWLDFLGISMDPKRADGMRLTINLVTPDNGEKYLIELSNATLTNIKVIQSPKPDLTVTVGRRLSPYVEGTVSLGYFDLSTDLRIRVLEQRREASRDVSWVDPLVGVNVVVPFSGKWTYTLRGDVGGFGVGSDFTWHMITTFRRQNTEKFAWYFGDRVVAFDHEDGRGQNYQRYDLRQHGPGVGIAIGF
jgi:hypothetical protein